MGKHITDRDRMRTLQVLFSREENRLPFSREKLEYLKPLSHRLNQLGIEDQSSNNHSMMMLRQMIDELLMEITAQVNWSVGETRTGTRKRVLSQFGLTHWSQFNSTSLTHAAKVA